MRTVEVETTIAQGLHVTDDSAGYDAACKRVLSPTRSDCQKSSPQEFSPKAKINFNYFFDGVLRMLDVLLSHETSEAEKRRILRDDYDIQMTQTMEREVSVMCNLSRGVEEKGVTKGILASIKNLMETLGLTIEQAMAALKVPENERQKYMDLLERQ